MPYRSAVLAINSLVNRVGVPLGPDTGVRSHGLFLDFATVDLPDNLGLGKVAFFNKKNVEKGNVTVEVAMLGELAMVMPAHDDRVNKLGPIIGYTGIDWALRTLDKRNSAGALLDFNLYSEHISLQTDFWGVSKNKQALSDFLEPLKINDLIKDINKDNPIKRFVLDAPQAQALVSFLEGQIYDNSLEGYPY